MYIKETTKNYWIIYESGHNPRNPKKTDTFAFDTENIVLCDGVQMSQSEIYEATKNDDMETKRNRLQSIVWAWQCYDEHNGFFMTNNFDFWLHYQCLCGYKFGWCYNAKFDFSQIDYKILCENKHKWVKYNKEDGKGQPFAYTSLHNDMGARYNYKLWIPYKNKYRHTRVHAVDYRDFMNIFTGGLAKMLEALDVCDNEGNAIRKLTMEYQAVDTNNLTQEQIEYCCVDVKGLYFGVKKYDAEMQRQSDGECCIFGKNTNIMTAGGFAKRELLRSLYPALPPKKRLKQYQKEHPITANEDKYLRDNHLYRGGICFVNPRFKGKLVTQTMYRYDVNSEYPYAMSVMPDLIGNAKRIRYDEWLQMVESGQSEEYECILELTAVYGTLKEGMCGVWYNPFRRDFVDTIDEEGMHLMYERQFNEMLNWYDIEYNCEYVIILKRGEKVYAPFVNENYALKAQAKRDKNLSLSAVVKLKSNSSYGKLAERIERVSGEFEKNAENGCVHFVRKDVEIDEDSVMSVYVGALVTAIARVWILSHIREICGENMQDTFIYIDTDSIHTLNKYDKADAFALGGLKLEAECKACKYIAPKTYFDVEEMNDSIIQIKSDKEHKSGVELHTKGVNIRAVKETLGDTITLAELDKKFNYGAKYIVLSAMNVRGGKVLIPIEKELARLELAPDNWVIDSGYAQNIISEV